MNGPVPTGLAIVSVGFAATCFATDSLRTYVLPRIVNSDVYCGVVKWRVTVLPETVGGEAWSGTPKMLALGLATTLYVAATSAGPKDEPSLNFTFWRIVSWMSLPPLANWKAVASQGCVPAAVGSSSSNSTSGSLTMLRVPMLDATEFESYGLKSCENVTPVVGSAMSGLPPDVVVLLLDCWHAVSTIAVT